MGHRTFAAEEPAGKDPTRRVGWSVRQMAQDRYRARVSLTLMGLGGIVLLALVALGVRSSDGRMGLVGLSAFFGLLLLIRLVADLTETRVRRIMQEERRAIRGAQAEETVGDILKDLDEDYMVLHDLISPHGNIDHVVITSRGGVFLLETKSHWGRISVDRGRILVNGHEPEKDFVAQVLRNARWLKEIIQATTGTDPWIIPMIVFTNAFVEPAPPIRGVRIINKRYLLNALKRFDLQRPIPAIWENREKIRERLIESVRTPSRGYLS